MRPIAIVLCGRTEPAVRARRFGTDFHDWFASALGEPIEVVEADLGAPLLDPERYAGAVLSGSPAMVTARQPWSMVIERWCTDAHGRTPLLGVCYGHQLLAQALGGEVADNPAGIEIGLCRLELTDEATDDPLFAAAPRPLAVYESHTQSVVRPPAGAAVLAHNAHDSNQALRLGPTTWSVQFHPEFDADITAGYLEARRAHYGEHGLDVDALLAELEEDPASRALLTRFAQVCRERADPAAG